jgi:hypothetical protein
MYANSKWSTTTHVPKAGSGLGFSRSQSTSVPSAATPGWRGCSGSTQQRRHRKLGTGIDSTGWVQAFSDEGGRTLTIPCRPFALVP